MEHMCMYQGVCQVLSHLVLYIHFHKASGLFVQLFYDTVCFNVQAHDNLFIIIHNGLSSIRSGRHYCEFCALWYNVPFFV